MIQLHLIHLSLNECRNKWTINQSINQSISPPHGWCPCGVERVTNVSLLFKQQYFLFSSVNQWINEHISQINQPVSLLSRFPAVSNEELKPRLSSTASWSSEGESYSPSSNQVYFSHKARLSFRHQLDSNINAVDATNWETHTHVQPPPSRQPCYLSANLDWHRGHHLSAFWRRHAEKRRGGSGGWGERWLSNLKSGWTTARWSQTPSHISVALTDKSLPYTETSGCWSRGED